MSSDSLGEDEKDGQLGNSRKTKQGDWGYGISRDIGEIACRMSRGYIFRTFPPPHTHTHTHTKPLNKAGGLRDWVPLI